MHKLVKLYKTGKPRRKEFLAGYGVGTYRDGKCIHVNDIRQPMTKEKARSILDILSKSSLSYFWPDIDESEEVKMGEAAMVLGMYKDTQSFQANLASISSNTEFVPPPDYVQKYGMNIRVIDTLLRDTLILTRV